MVHGSSSNWGSLERWQPRLFLVAGVLFVGHAAVRGVEVFTTAPTPVEGFGPAGYVAAILGLLGFYPALAARTPRTARFGGLLATLLIPTWALISAWSVGTAAGVVSPLPDVLPGAFFVVVIIATLLLYLLFGGMSLRSGVHARTFSLLLFGPVAPFALLIVGGVVLSVGPGIGPVVVGVGMAIAHGAIGGTLLTGETHHGSVAPTSDASMD